MKYLISPTNHYMLLEVLELAVIQERSMLDIFIKKIEVRRVVWRVTMIIAWRETAVKKLKQKANLDSLQCIMTAKKGFAQSGEKDLLMRKL